jgi:hypothetical protein
MKGVIIATGARKAFGEAWARTWAGEDEENSPDIRESNKRECLPV